MTANSIATDRSLERVRRSIPDGIHYSMPIFPLANTLGIKDELVAFMVGAIRMMFPW